MPNITFVIEIDRDEDGIWLASCEQLHLYADSQNYEDLLKIAGDMVVDMAVELDMAKEGQTIRLQFLQTQNLAVVA